MTIVGVGGGLLLWLGACAPYEPEVGGANAFPLPGPHAQASCEDCHGPPPFEAFIWDTTCVSCHDADRKPNDPAHAAYQTCSGAGCHADTDPDWGVAVSNVDHSFLPLQDAHALADPCTPCHSSGTPSAADVDPPGGNATYCWSCHEEKRVLANAGTPDDPILHFVDDPEVDTQIVGDSELRWDCKSCHDGLSRGQGTLSKLWIQGANHGPAAGREIKVPHGTQGQGVAIDESAWIVECADCHPSLPPEPVSADFQDFTCSDACHAEIFVDPRLAYHNGLSPGVTDAACSAPGCHPHADIRQQ
ncbi:MAG: hypothetical protein R3F59_28120 [Myxococcota bacterium]